MSEEPRKIGGNTPHSIPLAPVVVRAPVEPEKFEFSYGLLASADAIFAVIGGNPLPQMALSPKTPNQAQGSGGRGASTGK